MVGESHGQQRLSSLICCPGFSEATVDSSKNKLMTAEVEILYKYLTLD